MVLVAPAVVLAAPTPAAAATVTYVVNDLGDASDASPGNGVCATAGAVCTLRAAIEEANARPADDNRIDFGVQGTISTTGSYDDVVDPGLVIDGSTAPGFAVGAPSVTVLGTTTSILLGPTALTFTAAAPTVRGLRFGKWQRVIDLKPAASGAVIEGNQMGTDGTTFKASLEIGRGISMDSPSSRIGGPAASQRNLISGYLGRGIDVGGSATDALIEGNRIGTNAAGTAAVAHPSGTTQITIDGSKTINLAIDNDSPSLTVRGNLISGNPSYGIGITKNGNATVVGNLIGTDVTGTLPLPNTGISVAVQQGGHLQLGGTAPGEGNVVAATSSVNVDYWTFGTGVLVEQGATATIQGNWIGTNSTGAAGLANARTGIKVEDDATVATIGGTAAGAGNTIVASSIGSGIWVDPVVATQTAEATIQGNRIGTNPAGTAAVGTPSTGIVVSCGAKVAIGGTTAAAGNLISGHANRGIVVCDSRKGSTIQGNRVGTNAAGTAAIPNATGLGFSSVPSTGLGSTPIVIGGTTAGAGNQFSGNTGYGLAVYGPTVVQGNLIGTDPTGNAALPNGDYGMDVSNGASVVGGTTAGAGNLISGNTRGGISLSGTGSVIRGNRIGTNAAGTGPLGNGFAGVFVQSVTSATIGGTGAGEANVIAFNGREGVFVLPGASGVSIRGNRIHTNTRQAIELYQYGQIQGGGNKDQVPPTMTATLGAQTAVSGTIVSDVAGSVPIDVYASNACGPKGAGESKEWLGTITVNHPGGGVATAFSGNLPLPANAANDVITATATVAGKGTSQHSHCRNVSDLEVKGQANATTIPIGEEVGVLLTVTNKGPAPLSGVVVDVQPDVGSTRAADAYSADIPSKGTIDANTDAWTIGTLAAGQAASVCLRATPVRSASWFPGIETTYLFAHDDPYWGNDLWQQQVDVGSPKVAGANVCALPTIAVGDAQLARPTSGTAVMTFPVTLSAVQTRDVKVSYATQNGTAASVIDYTETTGTLTIPAGETTGKIEVPIVGNQSDEPNKAFTLLLSSPVHATISDGTATGTIQANGALAGCPTDATQVQSFVCHLYWDALGRQAESGGFTYWVGRLNKGVPRSTMVKTYLSQPESLRVLVDRSYVFYLGRRGTKAELTSYADKLAAKTITPEAIRIQLLASAEYYAGAGATNALWVTNVYRDVFRRSPDAGGQAYWLGKLNGGLTRSAVAKAMLTQDEGRRRVIDDIFLRFVRRYPPMAESAPYVGQMKAGRTEADVANAVVASAEYFNRP
ncbi:MAG: DUF4214 domain-containing protein [Acidimicrobiales bacterium]